LNLGFWGFGEQYVTERRTHPKNTRLLPKPQNPEGKNLKLMELNPFIFPAPDSSYTADEFPERVDVHSKDLL